MIIVSDSGPIISFARAGRLELLRQALNEIKIPKAVYEDIVIQGIGRPGAEEVKGVNWIKKETIKECSKVAQLPLRLGLGEREAIVLAQELEALLLIDDRPARKEAEKRGIVCFGSLRVLKEARGKGLIKEVRATGDKLRATGFRIKNTLYQKFLQEMKE